VGPSDKLAEWFSVHTTKDQRDKILGGTNLATEMAARYILPRAGSALGQALSSPISAGYPQTASQWYAATSPGLSQTEQAIARQIDQLADVGAQLPRSYANPIFQERLAQLEQDMATARSARPTPLYASAGVGLPLALDMLTLGSNWALPLLPAFAPLGLAALDPQQDRRLSNVPSLAQGAWNWIGQHVPTSVPSAMNWIARSR
jgi:hypothetical protein